ncbi:MAG: hypothetical protein IKH46_01905 [Lachnospiraceae bacterium]|nr:hypothetical protein [Lachnospiraceae bacterium]
MEDNFGTIGMIIIVGMVLLFVVAIINMLITAIVAIVLLTKKRKTENRAEIVNSTPQKWR